MAAVAGEGRHALAQTSDDGKKEVHQRQRRENQRQEPVRTDAMVNSIEIEAEKGDQETQHGASGIAHENAGGGKVIGQKSEASAQQAPSNGAPCADSRRRVHRGVTQRDQSRDTAGYTVRTVKKVECVHENGNKQASEDGIENRMAEERKIPLGLA